MSREMLISDRPKWSCKIVNFEKDWEVRIKVDPNFRGWVNVYSTKHKTSQELLALTKQKISMSKRMKSPKKTSSMWIVVIRLKAKWWLATTVTTSMYLIFKTQKHGKIVSSLNLL